MATITITAHNTGGALAGNTFATGFTSGDAVFNKHISNMIKSCRKTSCAANCKHKTAACSALLHTASF